MSARKGKRNGGDVADEQEMQGNASKDTRQETTFNSSGTTGTISSGSSSDKANECGTCTSSSIDYPTKGKWQRPTNALGRRFRHVARDDLPWDMQLYWPLSTEERFSLTKLTSAYQSITSTISEEDLKHVSQWKSLCLEKAIFMLDHSMRQYVKFARMVPEFRQLRQVDQIALLKASILQWHHIRQGCDFIVERRVWNSICGVLTFAELSQFLGDMQPVLEYAECCEGLKHVVKNDNTLYALMHALTLFDPRDSKVENRLQVNGFKDRYIVLLKHHLESQFSFLHSDRYMVEILEQLLILRDLGESSIIFYKHFADHFGPLIAEVFSD